MVWPVELLTAA